ncbi:CPBP family intramembrane glutamic endopeptidase [Nocardia yamanashiensis]|uniref:CPBP family intramembrane glutamic endopeptidase n=1 Tax=Nocardia yamanashiensis TaxID=209247 RepID=UPI0008335D3E|nr:type II CAAX endopeptidase family protein [Nocardia yamanashiensis]
MNLPKVLAAAALPTLWSNWALPALDLGIRGRSLTSAAFATGYAVAFQGNPNWLSSQGLRVGAAVGGVLAAGYAAALTIPPLRHRLAELDDRNPGVHIAEWAGAHIPGGTVYSEELVYRATLTPLLEDALGCPGRWLGALLFGIAHIRPARNAGDPIPATIAITGGAGLVFDELYRRTGSATAPALVHLALNAGGALTPVSARRLRR